MARNFEGVQIGSCREEIYRLRANRNIVDLNLKERQRELDELENRMPLFDPQQEAERQRRIEHLRRQVMELQYLYNDIDLRAYEKERTCSESDTQSPPVSPPNLHAELRRTIDEPRYWRDGDPQLKAFVTDGFKRLYPDDGQS